MAHPPPVSQAEAMAALLLVYQIIYRLQRRKLGAHTRNKLREIQVLIVPLLDRNNRIRMD